MIAPSARKTSENSADAEPNPEPSTEAGKTEPDVVIVDPFVIAPEMSTAPFMSIVVPLISTSSSDTRSNTPSALCDIWVPESPNCSWFDPFNFIPVSST